ncbi:MAG TPA: PadR family transcriptional regulator [Anaerohalosphaeraceae bacterium]|nr:PadR family transcriptional regulator [Anaerohalosphaeraceae bacterium]HOL89288.1 PadR family transcriptional regulator [Anaerohalosphaeraceae bacterium]HPP56872.1 PadR family transcriptional regulator [Anaerohalosphaeraceae bacterium]
MDLQNWQTQLRKGLLDIVVLNFLARGRCHGYEMVQELKKCRGLSVREGNIYPILARLQTDGLAEAGIEPGPGGPPRKYYTITERGKQILAEMNRHWDMIVAGVNQVRKGDNS